MINVSTATVAVPVIDNLYFDMNGIIHNCTHGNDPKRKPTETEMLLKIFDYLDKLVHIVQPQKLLFLAIDGAHSLCAEVLLNSSLSILTMQCAEPCQGFNPLLTDHHRQGQHRSSMHSWS